MADLSALPLPYVFSKTRYGPVALAGIGEDRLILSGKSNYEHPAQEYADKLAAADDEEYLGIAQQAIWLAAYAANNPTSDYHWQADACYCDAQRRGSTDLYQKAYERAAG
jgi:hypothetical protein